MSADDFSHGAMIAVSILIASHDQPTMAKDIVLAMGLQNYDCSGMDDFDKQNLRKLKGEKSINLRGLCGAADMCHPETCACK